MIVEEMFPIIISVRSRLKRLNPLVDGVCVRYLRSTFVFNRLCIFTICSKSLENWLVE